MNAQEVMTELEKSTDDWTFEIDGDRVYGHADDGSASLQVTPDPLDGEMAKGTVCEPAPRGFHEPVKSVSGDPVRVCRWLADREEVA